MGFPYLTFEDFSLYPSAFGTKREDYFLFGYDNVKLPKHAIELHHKGYEGISAKDFYDDIFEDYLSPHRLRRQDYLQGEYSGILIEKVPLFDKKNKPVMRTIEQKDGSTYEEQAIGFNRKSFHRGQEVLYQTIERSDNFVITSPVSYAGKNRTASNARELFALVIEVDSLIEKTGLDELFYQWERSNYYKGKKTYEQSPRPTYIVCSGQGLHLYFVFDEPIPLFSNIYKQLTRAKRYLTTKLWTRYISTLHDNIQYEPINQPFRAVGTSAKEKGVYALAFKTGGRYSINDLNSFLPLNKQIDYQKRSDLSLEEAKEKYPEWYERRIVQKKPLKTGESTYYRHRAVYDNWKKRIIEEANVGKRYFCLEHLCALAVACQISQEELEKDIQEVADYFERLTVSEDNHFTQNDIISAMSTYKKPNVNAFRRKLEYITDKTGIKLERAKRNGRTRLENIAIVHKLNELNREMNLGKDKGGRPSKAHLVKEWRQNNPSGTKIQCERETGISRPTVLKHWDS